jgi:RNA 3'-terminal phosphate cyclase
LLRQHLTAVRRPRRSAARSRARRSAFAALSFARADSWRGDYRFAIGTAGSTRWCCRRCCRRCGSPLRPRHAADQRRNPQSGGAAAGVDFQLLLPLALAGGGGFTTDVRSSHLTTNLEVIARFLPLRAQIEPAGRGWRVIIQD